MFKKTRASASLTIELLHIHLSYVYIMDQRCKYEYCWEVFINGIVQKRRDFVWNTKFSQGLQRDNRDNLGRAVNFIKSNVNFCTGPFNNDFCSILYNYAKLKGNSSNTTYTILYTVYNPEGYNSFICIFGWVYIWRGLCIYIQYLGG